MRIKRNISSRKLFNKKSVLGFSLIAYTGLVFISGFFFYRNGFYQKFQPLLLPFSEGFKNNPLESLWAHFRAEAPLLIDINHINVLKLTKKKEEAVKLKSLFISDTDWVNSKLKYKNKKIDARLRLKGQYSDHWREDSYWSYKLKLKKGKTLFGVLNKD